MNYLRCLFLALVALAAGPAAAQLYTVPPGAYRTAEAYHRRQPQPAGTNAFFPDKRGNLVVVVPRNGKNVKLRVAPDSLWGYVNAKARSVRFYRGEEYKLEFADTLCIYSSTTVLIDGQRQGAVIPSTHTGGQYLNNYTPRYFFSRGLKGLIFPLNVKFLTQMYATSNPVFAAALEHYRSDDLAKLDKNTGLYYVTILYRRASGH